MEPDFDKILSNKIRRAELRPIVWNKKEVWHNVQSEARPKRHYVFFYYAAAAIVSLLIYFAVEQIPTEIEPPVADANTTPPQEVAEPKSPAAPEKSQAQVPAPATTGSDVTRTAPKTLAPSSTSATPASPRQEMQDADAIAEPVLADIQLPDEVSLTLEEVEIAVKKIRPVVGVIAESYSENITNVKRKKKRLHKLEPSPAVPWEDPGNALVFTVRK